MAVAQMRVADFKPKFTMGQWVVSIPPKMTASGKRERKFFGQDQNGAQSFASALRRKYHDGKRGLLSAAEAAIAADAMKLLEPLGINLLEAARLIVKQHEVAGTTETFRERWMRFQLHHEMQWSRTYVEQVERMPNWLGDDFMELRVAAINDTVIRETIARKAKAKSTMALRMRMVAAVISEKGKEKKAVKIEIMTDEQVETLLEATKDNRDERWAVALLLFAGIRPGSPDGEITRMEWESVGEDEIYLPHEVTKTGTDRHIPITPRLRELLKRHPREGLIAPTGWTRRWTRLRALAGISDKQDVTRHTFASHFLAVYGENATKSAMGHTAGSDTLFRHYRKAVLERDGLAYFGLESSD